MKCSGSKDCPITGCLHHGPHTTDDLPIGMDCTQSVTCRWTDRACCCRIQTQPDYRPEEFCNT